MTWERVKSTEVMAVGKKGTFTLNKSCGLWWGMYNGTVKSFRMRPCETLKELKEQCENNHYWEKEEKHDKNGG